MANSSPPLSAYCALMACCLIALDKRPGVRPVGIGEKLRQVIAKLVMRAAGCQVKTVCESLQLCAGLEVGIERATHTVAQRRKERIRPEPGGGADKGSEGTEVKSSVEPSRTSRVGEAERVDGIGEVPLPPG